MTGIYWNIAAYCVVLFFLVVMAYRVVSIRRLPVHLRWELAPIPYEKGKYKYGGSYLEEHEWWNRKREKSFLAPLVYMGREIILQKGVWKNNRPLWPFTFSLHTGIYLFVLALVLHLVNALLLITEVSEPLTNVFQNIALAVAATGSIFGIIGAAGLILKRAIDTNLRYFSSFSTFFRLVFLAAVFISGGTAIIFSNNYALEMGTFIRDMITFDSITVSAVSAAHIIISFLFILYLPFTDMVHFITKYFTYHAVRWDDEPQNIETQKEINRLVNQPVSWSAAHIKSGSGRNWKDTVQGDAVEKEKP